MNNLQKKLPELVERAEHFLKLIGIKDEIRVFNESHCDPRIEIGTSGIGVSILEGERKTIAGSIPEIQYGAFRTEFIPGVRYYRDGSGEPDSVETEDIGEAERRPDRPLTNAVMAYVEMMINNELDREDAEADAKYEKDYQDYLDGGGNPEYW